MEEDGIILQQKNYHHYLIGITSKHKSDNYFLNCLHSFRTENKLKQHKKEYEMKDVCSIVMPSEDTKILELNQYQKPDKAPIIIYADLEYLIIGKIGGCKNNSENSSATKVGENFPSSFSMSRIP